MPLFGKSIGPEEPSFVKTPFEKRKQEAEKILTRWPDRVPVIVERAESSRNNIPAIDKKKYLVPEAMTFSQFILVIRKRIKLAPEQAIFLYVNNILPPASHTMGQVYAEHKDEDLFLKCVYAAENSFGA